MALAKPASRPMPQPRQRRPQRRWTRALSKSAALLVSIAGLTGVMAVIVLLAVAVIGGVVALAVGATMQ